MVSASAGVVWLPGASSSRVAGNIIIDSGRQRGTTGAHDGLILSSRDGNRLDRLLNAAVMFLMPIFGVPA